MPNDEDGLMLKFKECALTEQHAIEKLLVHYETAVYPGKQILEQSAVLFKSINEIKDVLPFYERLEIEKETLTDYEEQAQAVKNFFKNQRTFFDRALRALQIHDKNKTYIVDAEVNETESEIRAIVKDEKPYSRIQELPGLIDSFNDRFIELLQTEIKPVITVVENDRDKVLKELEQYPFKEELMATFNRRFQDLLDRLKACNNFYEAIAMREESDRVKINCFDDIERKQQELIKEPGSETDPPGVTKPHQKRIVTISIAKIFHGSGTIDSEEDIEILINNLRRQLKEELKENTRLKLI